MLDKIIFIVGSPRSGSSLIYNALGTNKIFNPAIPESHLVTNLIKNFYKQHKRNLSIEKNYFFENIHETKLYFKKCIELFFNKISNKYSVSHLLLKSITITDNINILHEVYPEIFFIMTIRDPKDIITSMINLGQRQEKLKISNQFPRNIDLLCQKINTSYRHLINDDQNYFTKKNVFTIKYENFVLEPANTLNKTIKNISQNIYYNNNFNAWERSSDNYLEKNNKTLNPYMSDLWNKPINKSRIGIYKTFLEKKEIEKINFNCKKIIELFNY